MHARTDDPGVARPRDWPTAGGESPSSIVAGEWNDLLEMRSEKRVANRARTPTPAPTPVKQAVKEAVRPVVKEARLARSR